MGMAAGNDVNIVAAVDSSTKTISARKPPVV
ncbi:hypothetical protein [Herbaspirillum rubrisubalbicans]|nr:hypothetical protein [Herbaspirillum rubrisubalbicans]